MRYCFFIALLLVCSSLLGQPSNDDCANAAVITIPNKGFATGVFVGQKTLMDDATREIGETCAEDIKKLGNCDKTIWYKFYIPTTRDVEVLLTQKDSAIPQIFAGFTIYKVEGCNTNSGNISSQLTPISKFGSSGNACLQMGYYYIQVSAKNRVKGEAWIELIVSKPATDPVDSYLTPYDFGKISNSYRQYGVSTNCYTITEEESSNIKDTNYTKSLWFKVNFEANSINNTISVQNGPQVFAYRFFNAAPTVDSLKSNKPYQFHSRANGDLNIYKNFCSNLVKDTSFYIQIILLNDPGYFRLTVISYRDVQDDWNKPSTTTFKFKMAANSFKKFTRNFNCDGLLANHGCKPLIADKYYAPFSYVYGGGEQEVDTARYGAYMIVEAEAAGELIIQGSNASSSQYYLKYVLFEGNIKDNCNLKYVGESSFTNSGRFCLDAKTYTVLVVKNEHYSIANQINFSIWLKTKDENIEHYKHTSPEKMDDYVHSTAIANVSLISKTISMYSKDTLVEIDTFKRTGRFIFREIYFAEDNNDINIQNRNYGPQYFTVYLFKGRFQDNNLAHIVGFNYNNNATFFPSCLQFDKGYYTIISVVDTTGQNMTPCNLPKDEIHIIKNALCTPGTEHMEPNEADALNGNQDLASNSAMLVGMNYEYPLNRCVDCHSKSKNLPQLSCKKTFPRLNFIDTQFYYYTFYIKNNAELILPYNSVLYKGNVLTNNAVVQDSNNIIDPCSDGYIYCNLEGGEHYTIVLVGKQYGLIKLILTPHIKSPNDFAATAHDFGHLNNGVKVSSPYLPITCHTYASVTDPYSDWTNSYALNIPYKDTLNKSRQYARRNLWYTFTASGVSKINLEVLSKRFCHLKIFVYKYTGPFYGSYNATLLNNFDSTLKNLKFIAENLVEPNTNCNENYMQFKNVGCTDARYFVLLEWDSRDLNAMYQLSLTLNDIPNVTKVGDLCEDAVSDIISSIGAKKVSTNNNCHTYGGSPFEKYDENLKSTWFRIDVQNLSKIDLEFKYLSTKYPLVKFNIYAGNCRSLTKVASLNDQYSYFTLSCMGEGSFYIQAITDSKIVGNLEFQVKASSPLNVNCKPYDFDQPLSQFEIEGGCTTDSLFLINYSTQGLDMRYEWYVNDIKFDTSLHSMANKNSSIFVTDNKIKLVVINIANGNKDSSSQYYRKDTTAYYVKIKGPSKAYCGDAIFLSFETNYPYKLNNTWTGDYISNPYKENQEIWYNPYDRVYTIESVSDNCVFRDTFTFEENKRSKFFKDTSLCGGNTALEYDISNFSNLTVNGNKVTGNILKLDTTGVYTVFFYYNNCYFYDTINVTFGNDLIKVTEYDTLRICNSNELSLSYKHNLLNYKWNTGSEEKEIGVNAPGDYFLNGWINGCKELDYFVTVVKDSVPVNFLRDTLVCQNSNYDFKNPVPHYPEISRNPNTTNFLLTENTRIKMTIGSEGCNTTDSAMVNVIKTDNIYLNSAVCFSEDIPFITLDAMDALTYDWLGLNTYTRTKDVSEYKKYTVERTNILGCKDTVFFTVNKDCPFNIYIPNAFTPNDDGLNSTFKPEINGTYLSYHMTIANRWGEILYKGENGEWDGTYMGNPVQNGVYVVLATVKTTEKTFYFKGTITLLH